MKIIQFCGFFYDPKKFNLSTFLIIWVYSLCLSSLSISSFDLVFCIVPLVFFTAWTNGSGDSSTHVRQ